MRWWPDRVARIAFVVLLAVALLFVASRLGFPGKALLIASLVIGGIAIATIQMTVFSGASWRRVQPALEEEIPSGARAHVGPGGAFEWHPAGETRIGVRHGIVHRWWDAEAGPRLDVSMAFDIPDELSPDGLRKATEKALRAATSALPGRGKVRAKGAARDEPGPTSLVRVKLAVQGVGATPDWARVAAEHFARAFLATLKARGHVADRR